MIIKITVIDYNVNQFHEKIVENVEECFRYRDNKSVTWINVDGIHKVDIIEKIGNCFGAHPLILEDIANTSQRPKFEDMDDYIERRGFVLLGRIDEVLKWAELGWVGPR